MNFPLLLSEIIRGTWAVEPRLALSYGPLIAKLISGEDIVIEKEKPSLNIVTGDDIKILAETEDNGENIFSSAPKGSIAIIPLQGAMRKYGGLCSYGTDEIAQMLRDAADSPNIDSTIFKIDSGGGAVDSIAPLIDAKEYHQAKGKPVLVLADLCASAAYYFASSTDMIIADNDISAEFGSIGVMVSFMDMKGYYEKEGMKMHTVYAPESTHKNIALENALQEEPDYTLIKEEILSPLAKQFQSAVKKNRKGKLDENIEGILNGKMFYAKDALKNGLIDKIGNMDFAIKQAKKLSTIYQIKNNY